jgi:predicted ATP-grasp superfamily ATP-dependent carboligase
MASPQGLVIFGASARAAAFSALRAGLRPWCADLFADHDLQARCHVVQLSPAEYPNGFVKISAQAPSGPWIYTGGLENRPEIVEKISQGRPLWGNIPEVLAVVRSPLAVARKLKAAGIPCPCIHLLPEEISSQGRWLVKPWGSAGGAGIHYWSGKDIRQSRGRKVYYQEFIEGLPCSAVFVGDGRQARLLGATRQLVAESWLHAAPFHYCGSIGPLSLATAQRSALENIGETLVKEFHLRGLFGVDFILSEESPWPVEINPRYPASVEILEYALGVTALAAHRRVFDSDAPEPRSQKNNPTPTILGKAILFARTALIFPKEGPWLQELPNSPSCNELPDSADIPPVGRFIPAGKPILTLFCRSSTTEECLKSLKQIARDLDHRFYGD